MTVTTDFDRLLASVLEADGPQSIPDRVVDGAIVDARSIPQRRPILRGLDRRAWPGRVATAGLGTRQLIMVGTVGLLLVAIAAAMIVGSGRSRPSLDLLADGARVTYSDNATLVVVDATGIRRRDNVAIGRGDLAPALVPGTNLATLYGFSEWQVIDLESGSAIGTVSTDYAGFERWSANGERLALVDLSGVIEIAGFEDRRSPTTTRFDMPGLESMDLSWDGRRMAVVVSDGPTLRLDIIDIATGDRRTAHVFDPGVDPPNPAEGSTVGVVWASEADHVVVSVPTETDDSEIWLVDLDGALAKRIDAASLYWLSSSISRDGSRISAYDASGALYVIDAATGGTVFVDAGPSHSVPVGWSSDGGRLAILNDGVLRVIHPDGIEPTTELTGVLGADWVNDRDVLVVVRTTERGLSVDALAEDGELRTLAVIADIQPSRAPAVSVEMLEDQP